jgi:[FeFe] hydrogenase (group B1/B3)
MSDNLVQEIDRIPIEMRPRKGNSSRCCVYKDRAVLKYKMMALMGFNIQDETDELTHLSEYAQQALERESISSTILTVVDEACSACVKVNYVVTNMCRGCVGRPCVLNCPKDAINIVDGKACIDHSKCINCGKCQKACPYHAIIYQPIPCEEACPVGAITKNAEGVEHINEEKCINCGKCVIACPFGAVVEKTHLVEIIKAFKSEQKVVALPAPSIIGQFKADYTKILGALKKLGFDEIVEVAAGAELTAKHEANEFLEHMEKGQSFMTTSCCPAYTQTVDKHLPELKPFVSSTPSPMAYAAALAKEKYPGARVVFIGPCIAKRSEGFYDSNVDYTLSFEELGALFIAKGINVIKEEDSPNDASIVKHAHGFAAVQGVTQSLMNYLPKDYALNNLVIDGIDKTTLRQLKTFASGKSPASFIEVMACEGGCVAGPNSLSNPKIAAKQISDFVTE